MLKEIFKEHAHALIFGMVFVTTAVTAASASAAQGDAKPVVLEASRVTEGDVFECRIPINVKYDGQPRLTQFRIIAKAYHGEKELASTGLSSDYGTVLGELEKGGLSYESVPLQFDLSPAMCREADSLRIEFASCVFGEHPAEDCLGQVRFASAEKGDPLFLPLDR